MTNIFTLRKNPDNIHSIRMFDFKNIWSVHFKVDAQRFVLASCVKKYLEIKDSSQKISKAKIKLWNSDDCACNLCKRLITNIEHIHNYFFQSMFISQQAVVIVSTLNKEMYVIYSLKIGNRKQFLTWSLASVDESWFDSNIIGSR